MSFTYCKSCGHKNIYAVNPPNFCGSCGASLGSTVKSVPVKKFQKPARRRIERVFKEEEEEEDQEGLDINYTPVVSNFKCSISSDPSENKKFKLGELIPNLDELSRKQSPQDEE